MYSKKTQRRMRVMTKALMGIAAIAFTLWLVWYEFGEGIFENIKFMLLILIWVITGFTLFLDDLTKVEKTSDEKIDELIKEIRLDREQRNREANKDGK